MAYIYNPSQSISQKFESAQKSAENIFATAIQQKQQDFKFAQDLETNIEALKKDVNKYNKDEVYKDTNEILSNIGEVINKNGRLDYNQLREVKQKVAEIKSYKVNSDLAEQEWEAYNKMIANDKGKIYVNTPELFVKLTEVMKDKNSVANGTYSEKFKNVLKEYTDVNAKVRETNKMFFGDASDYQSFSSREVEMGEGKFKFKIPLKTEIKGKVIEGLVAAPRTISVLGKEQTIYGWKMSDEIKQRAYNVYGEGGQGYSITQEYREKLGGAPEMTDEQVIDYMMTNSYSRPIATEEDADKKYNQELRKIKAIKDINKPYSTPKPTQRETDENSAYNYASSFAQKLKSGGNWEDNKRDLLDILYDTYSIDDKSKQELDIKYDKEKNVLQIIKTDYQDDKGELKKKGTTIIDNIPADIKNIMKYTSSFNVSQIESIISSKKGGASNEKYDINIPQ